MPWGAAPSTLVFAESGFQPIAISAFAQFAGVVRSVVEYYPPALPAVA